MSTSVDLYPATRAALVKALGSIGIAVSESEPPSAYRFCGELLPRAGGFVRDAIDWALNVAMIRGRVTHTSCCGVDEAAWWLRRESSLLSKGEHLAIMATHSRGWTQLLASAQQLTSGSYDRSVGLFTPTVIADLRVAGPIVTDADELIDRFLLIAPGALTLHLPTERPEWYAATLAGGPVARVVEVLP